MDRPEADGRPDDDLIRAVLEDRGSDAAHAAFSQLLSRYQRPIFVWCMRYVRDRERALDLSQEVMMKIWESLPRFHFQSKFSWWVFVITRNRCFNALAEPRTKYRHEELDPQLLHPQPGSDERLETLENITMVRHMMLLHLDAQERQALALSHFEQMPVEEITRLLGLSNATGARALLQRARRKLRTAVERHTSDEARP
jgi:RNA polymerase sigma-70 factor (ECF subfamily)